MCQRQPHPSEARARELCIIAGIEPDSRVPVPGEPHGEPAWYKFRAAADAERQATRNALNLREAAAMSDVRPDGIQHDA